MQAVGNYVLVKRDKVDSVTPGGIVLPETSKRKSSRGTVVSAGFDASYDIDENEEPIVGSRVLFATYSGVDVDEEHVVLKSEEILCTL